MFQYAHTCNESQNLGINPPQKGWAYFVACLCSDWVALLCAGKQSVYISYYKTLSLDICKSLHKFAEFAEFYSVINILIMVYGTTPYGGTTPQKWRPY